MPLITLRDINLTFGIKPLLNKESLQICSNERLCIVGRNGEGKSSLLQIISGNILPDAGERIVQQNIKIATLPQEVPQNQKGSVFNVIAMGLSKVGNLLNSYHNLVQQMQDNSQINLTEDLMQLQHQIDITDGWKLDQKIVQLISKLKLNNTADFSKLSGGMKRRVLLAKALIQEPNILLLDEPTNHLDIESIQWMEKFLTGLKCSIVFITHDRSFLKTIATRIIELDRGNLSNWNCDYNTYLKRKEHMLEAESNANSNFDKKLAQEETWIRQGIKARRTRNEGRVRALEKLRQQHKERRERQCKVKIQQNNFGYSGKQVIEVENIRYSWSEKEILKNNFSTTIMRGDKIAIIGKNGCGKSTLLQLLLGQIQPTHGKIKLGTNLKIAYSDQHRNQLDLEKTVAENVIDGTDTIEVNGNKKHITSYLKDFLFSPEKSRQPVKALSGGEKNRLLLAKTFAQPSNLLVLDEPTNDLDLETLELLENLLVEYEGTILLVSHDRYFINQVATSSIVFDAPGIVNEYIGGYEDWIRQRPKKYSQLKVSLTSNKVQNKTSNKSKTSKKQSKLTYKEQEIYNSLPDKIENLEKILEEMSEKLNASNFYKQESNSIKPILKEIKITERALEKCFSDWEELEQKI